MAIGKGTDEHGHGKSLSIDSIPQIERQRDIELVIVESPMSGHSFRVSSIILKQRSASATQAVVLLHKQPLWNFAFQ